MSLIQEILRERLHEVIYKLALGAAIVAVGYFATEAVRHVYDLHYEAQARAQYNTMLLTFMRGGLPAVNARCVLESKHVVEIAPCIKASTPVPGRQL